MQTPMAYPDTLPTLLSMKLLTPVDYLRIESFGPFTAAISQILATPERYLKHKKALIMQFGTSALLKANGAHLMVNIREEDENRLLLDKKSCVFTYDNLKSVEKDDLTNDRLWEDLPQKHVYVIAQTGETEIASFSINQIDSSANVVCMIPAVCFRGQSASISVNGIKKHIPAFDKKVAFDPGSPAGRQFRRHIQGRCHRAGLPHPRLPGRPLHHPCRPPSAGG